MSERFSINRSDNGAVFNFSSKGKGSEGQVKVGEFLERKIEVIDNKGAHHLLNRGSLIDYLNRAEFDDIRGEKKLEKGRLSFLFGGPDETEIQAVYHKIFSEPLYSKGINLIKNNLNEGFKLLETAANQGYAPAQNELAAFYFNSKGVERNDVLGSVQLS